MKLEIKRIISLLCITILTISIVNCKKVATEPLLKGVITFKKGDVLINQKTANVGDRITEKDTITTSTSSIAIVQFANSALITLKQNTSLYVSSLAKNTDGSDNINLAQSQGSTFSKIISGKAKYEVSTPTVTAGVRGTAFSVTIDKDQKATIKLLHGSLYLAKPKVKDSVEEQIVDKIVTVSDESKAVTIVSTKELTSSEPKVIDKKEIEQLQTLDSIDILPAVTIDKLSVKDSTVVSKINTEMTTTKVAVVEQLINNVVEEADTKVAETKITLDDLKRKYGILSKVITKDNKAYVGSFSQKSKTIKIITVDGVVNLKATDVLKVVPQN